MKYKKNKIKRLDYQETVSEEINLMLNLETAVVNEAIEIDTIAGKMIYKAAYNNLMKDVYGFIYGYGLKLSEYGRLERINCT